MIKLLLKIYSSLFYFSARTRNLTALGIIVAIPLIIYASEGFPFPNLQIRIGDIFFGALIGIAIGFIYFIVQTAILCFFIRLNERNDEKLKEIKVLLENENCSEDDCKVAMAVLKNLDEYLHAESQYFSGSIYLNGRKHIKKNIKEAKRLFERATIKGHTKALSALGEMYYRGKGIPCNYDESFKLISKAAEQGGAIAQNNLGWMYEHGQGVSQDYEQAVKWYSKSAKQDDVSAQTNLGWMYKEGLGITQNYKEAFRLWCNAAEEGDAKAQFNLGLMYHEGDGIPKDYEQAIKWWSRAAEQGDKSAQHNLSVLRDG